MTARFRDTGRGSFWGDYVYERVVPKKHFLRQLAELIDWDSLTEGLADHYKGGARLRALPPSHSAEDATHLLRGRGWQGRRCDQE